MARRTDSRRVGKLLPRRGPSRQVFQARRELVCGRCGATIAVEEGFTRGDVLGRHMAPICGGCLPLDLFQHDTWGPAKKRTPPANVKSFRERSGTHG
jgi:hypothetical protein